LILGRLFPVFELEKRVFDEGPTEIGKNKSDCGGENEEDRGCGDMGIVGEEDLDRPGV